MPIKKILCTMDFSDDAKIGMAYATSFARENKAELVFLYVMRFPSWDLTFPPEPGPFLDGIPPPRFSMNDLYRVSTSSLDNFIHVNCGRQILGLSWKTRIGLGNMVREIVAAAVGEKADLVIMTKRKRGILGRVFARSIVEAVSERVPCPVLVLCR